MADPNPIASLYPAPAQPQPSALAGNPLSLIGPMMQLQQFGANRAVGQAFQGAVGPDGTFNPNSALSALSSPLYS